MKFVLDGRRGEKNESWTNLKYMVDTWSWKNIRTSINKGDAFVDRDLLGVKHVSGPGLPVKATVPITLLFFPNFCKRRKM